ncbi:MAG TPA: crosslink repair DNA glycosylase YcaQ family protein [Actinomycetota bacterium]|nr:crosslink repair DNA glycosylase YcaQ family protein [Actinomycetota bacterium]
MGADLEQVRWWSWRRQRLDRSCRGIDDCLRSIIGVYSSNPQGALSLLARVPRLMQGMVEGAVDSRIALRLPAMRRTVWMLHVETAHLAFRATDTSAPFRWLLKREGFSEDEYARLEHEILLAAGRPMTGDQIREAIKDPPEKLSPVLQALCAEGKLIRVKPKTAQSNVFTYAAMRVWLGHELPDADPTEALTWLAGDYLKAFAPATVEDFAWWAGVPQSQAEAAVGAHEPADLGDGLLMFEKDVRGFEGTRPVANRVNLLPAWDAYTMGYAGSSRARFADPSIQPYLYDKGGNATSVILVEGTVAGLWDYVASDRKIEIRVGFFDEPSPRAMAAIEAEAGLVASYFHARETVITRVRIGSPISAGPPGAHLKPLAPRAAKPAPKPAPTTTATPKPATAPKPVPAKAKPVRPARRRPPAAS